MAEDGIRQDGAGALQARLARAQRELPRVLAQVLFTRLSEAVTYARTRYLSGGTTTDRLAVRTGRLRAAFGMEVQQQGSGVQARIGYILPQGRQGGGDALVYARIHEGWPDGRASTTMRPRNAQYLAIPLAAAKTPAGVARGGPRDFPDTFVQRSRQGTLILFQQVGSGGIVPLFILKREVVIPARPALRPTMQRFTPLILDDLGKAVQAALGG